MEIDKSDGRLVLIGCISAGLGVAFGAFGAHMLKNILDPSMLAAYDTGTRYQMFHAFGMILCGLAVRVHRDPRMALAGWMFLIGTVLFSGSLYGMALLGMRWLGPVTPVGGLMFILGWALFAWRACRAPTLFSSGQG
ncbi:MAG TPA: DUF423 domain-containing protein [Nitrospira sp.]|jgi:uncharacterized membrane protein YgdD (TMEM256/DUF423 family)|nr:DUF423 domain-containing protein [Nitrospira sp.]